MAYIPRFGTAKRDAIFACEALIAWKAGLGRDPICNIPGCGLPVTVDQAWDESHHPDQPRVFGGRSVGVAHSKCNRDHGAQVVKPQVAKCDRVRDRHLGLTGPGLGPHPMKAGRRSRITKTLHHGIKRRQTLGEKLAATLARRNFRDVDVTTGGEAS